MIRQVSFVLVFCALAFLPGKGQAQTAPVTQAPKAVVPMQNTSVSAELLSVKRIYVAQLTGGLPADSLRELIISSINATNRFILTDNPDRADAVLKGAADEHAFEDIFDHQDSVGARTGVGAQRGGILKSTGAFGTQGVTDNEYHHTRERKHEAYAAVRLCNRDGDVLWSTTEESQGGKFRGAGADVAAKIARDLTFALERASRAASSSAPSPAQ